MTKADTDEDVDVAELIASDSQIYASIDDQDGVLQIKHGGEKPDLPTLHEEYKRGHGAPIETGQFAQSLSDIASYWYVGVDGVTHNASQYEMWAPVGNGCVNIDSFRIELQGDQGNYVTVGHSLSSPYVDYIQVVSANQLSERLNFTGNSCRIRRNQSPLQIDIPDSWVPFTNGSVSSDGNNWIRGSAVGSHPSFNIYVPVEDVEIIEQRGRRPQIAWTDSAILQAASVREEPPGCVRQQDGLYVDQIEIIPGHRADEIPDTDELEYYEGVHIEYVDDLHHEQWIR